jgi:alpha-tubulin suppressor-like RCC1 family protein
LDCTAPINIVGSTYDVTITNPDYTTATLTPGFAYQDPPTFTSISPAAAGPGAQVTIVGTNFSTSTAPQVLIGGSDCVVDTGTSTSTTLYCTLSKHIPGLTHVVITNSDQQSVTGSNSFTYAYASNSVATGGSHTCALLNGNVWCWGNNFYGQLGNTTNAGTNTENPTPIKVTGLSSGVSAITAGAYHTCALVTGSIYCWGAHDVGQLGNNVAINASANPTPQQVKFSTDTALTHIQNIAAGQNHTCAFSSGSVYCWGSNSSGQLGLDPSSVSNSIYPHPVTFDPSVVEEGIRALAGGAEHSCILTSGTLYCWGDNGFGQLGNSATIDTYNPVQVIDDSTSLGIVGASSIALGAYHSCTIADGVPKCWGKNLDAQLGDGTTTDSSVAINVDTSTGTLNNAKFQTITAGNSHTCGIANGKTYCWGLFTDGQLGDGAYHNQQVPDPSYIVDQFSSGSLNVSGGGQHSCGINSNGIYCWGDNTYGQVGSDPVSVGTSVPAPLSVATSTVQFNSVLSSVSLGYSHACAVVGGGVKCWGRNNLGQIGNNAATTDNILTPTAVVDSGGTSLSDVQFVASGLYHSCALTNGTTRCWGDNTYGQLGETAGGSFKYARSAITITVPPATTEGISKIALGNYHTCALRAGSVWCWGNNTYGQLGNNSTTDSSDPVQVQESPGVPLTNVQDIAAGAFHTCALKNGSARCWGYNSSGQIGIDSSTLFSMTTISVALYSGAADSITAGANHTCVVGGGLAQCWGNNSYGQLGDNSVTNSSTPKVVQISSGNLSGVTQVTAGYSHTCAIADGTPYCWGYNYSGQLGNNTTTNSGVALPLYNSAGNAGLTGVQTIFSGGFFTCVFNLGGLQCAGSNSTGQLGNNNTTSSKLLVNTLGF